MKSFYSNLIIIKRYYKKPVFSLYLLHKTICMRTSIHIGALHFYAHHGVLPQEQKVGNYFKVETTLYTDFSRALVTDELVDLLPKLTASGYFVDSPLMAAALETGIQKYVDYLSAKFSRNKSAGHN